MKDSIAKSAIVGRVGYTVDAAGAEQLIENGYAVFMACSGFVAAAMAWWSKVKQCYIEIINYTLLQTK